MTLESWFRDFFACLLFWTFILFIRNYCFYSDWRWINHFYPVYSIVT